MDCWRRRCLAAAFLILPALPHPAVSADRIFESGPTRVSLLEVYSSEGCSSCPPAERWLSDLISSPDLWKRFVPACFHVDYWDYLGWKDILASNAHTLRQRRRGGRSVYTPGFFVDGREWKGWFNGDSQVPGRADVVGSLRAKWSPDGAVEVEFRPEQEGDGWDVEAALLGMDIVSQVRAGENRGRTLRHDFSVVSTVRKSMTVRNGKWTVRLVLPKPAVDAPRHAVGVWVLKNETPIQAAGGWIP